MAKSNAWANQLLLLLFNNDGVSLIGDATGLLPSGVDGNLYISLHTSDPGAGGNQTTNEATYTGYARVAVARATGAGGWAVTAGAVENVSAVTYAICTAGSDTVTHFGIGTSISGAGKLLYSSALTASRAISAGITPSFAAGAIDATES